MAKPKTGAAAKTSKAKTKGKDPSDDANSARAPTPFVLPPFHTTTTREAAPQSLRSATPASPRPRDALGRRGFAVLLLLLEREDPARVFSYARFGGSALVSVFFPFCFSLSFSFFLSFFLQEPRLLFFFFLLLLVTRIYALLLSLSLTHAHTHPKKKPFPSSSKGGSEFL